MRDHVPTVGFVCAVCHEQSFPERQQEYAYLLAGRVVRARYVQSPDSAGAPNRVSTEPTDPAHGALVDAGDDTTVVRSLRVATDLDAAAPAARVHSSTLADEAVAKNRKRIKILKNG